MIYSTIVGKTKITIDESGGEIAAKMCRASLQLEGAALKIQHVGTCNFLHLPILQAAHGRHVKNPRIAL